MSLTLTAEPAVIDGVRSYAERSGMTLEAFVLAFLESVAFILFASARFRHSPILRFMSGVSCSGVAFRARDVGLETRKSQPPTT